MAEADSACAAAASSYSYKNTDVKEESTAPYRIISHCQIYDKYSNKYECDFFLTQKAKDLYLIKYEQIHKEKYDCHLPDILDDFENDRFDEDHIIDDPILIEILLELGIKDTFDCDSRHNLSEFQMWTVNPKYKGYCSINIWSDGSRTLKINYDKYKIDRLQKIINHKSAEEAYIEFKKIMSEPEEKPLFK